MDVKQKNAALFYLKLVHVQHLEDCSTNTAQRRIKQVFDLLPKERPTKHAKITLAEYAEHFQLPIDKLCESINQKFILNITP